MYAAAAFIPLRVGVGLPVVVRPIAATIAAPFIGPIGTSGVGVTVHELLLPKNFRPQLTIVSVVLTTWFSAAVTWLQREFAPQFRMQVASALQSIDPERSWMIKMSGGSGAAPWFTDAQFMSGLDAPFPSARVDPSTLIVGTMPVDPARPVDPASAGPTAPVPPAPPAPSRPGGWWNAHAPTPNAAITTAIASSTFLLERRI